jgi:hypothetical protein
MLMHIGEPVELRWVTSDGRTCRLEWHALDVPVSRPLRFMWNRHWVSSDEVWTAAVLANQVQTECDLIASCVEVDPCILRTMVRDATMIPISDEGIRAVLHARVGISLHQIGKDDMLNAGMFDDACRKLELNSFRTHFSDEWSPCVQHWIVTSSEEVEFMRTLPTCIGIFKTRSLPVIEARNNIRDLPASFQCVDVEHFGGFSSCRQLMNVVLPGQLRILGRRAFAGCAYLRHVTMPAGLVAIQDGAFSDCHRLKLNGLPRNLDEIGRYAFLNCCNLIVNEFPPGLRIVRDYAFSHCANIDIDTFPVKLNHIGAGAFESCCKLQLREIQGDVVYLKDRVFTGCTRLQLKSLPANLKEIGQSTFEACKQLVLGVLPAGEYENTLTC